MLAVSCWRVDKCLDIAKRRYLLSLYTAHFETTHSFASGELIFLNRENDAVTEAEKRGLGMWEIQSLVPSRVKPSVVV